VDDNRQKRIKRICPVLDEVLTEKLTCPVLDEVLTEKCKNLKIYLDSI